MSRGPGKGGVGRDGPAPHRPTVFVIIAALGVAVTFAAGSLAVVPGFIFLVIGALSFLASRSLSSPPSDGAGDAKGGGALR